MKLANSTEIISVTAIKMVDGTEEELYEIMGSMCHFYKEFCFQDYIIQLRLDWRDIYNGEPKLDADIWRKPKNKKNRLKNGHWHQNPKKIDSKTGRGIYEFEFQSLKLRLGTRTTAATNIPGSITVVKPQN